MAAAGTSGLAAALAAGMGSVTARTTRRPVPAHRRGLAAAVLLAAEHRLDGAATSLPTAGRPASGFAPWPAQCRGSVADWATEVIGTGAAGFQRGPIRPACAATRFRRRLVANDRLKPQGGTMATNEQAYVEAPKQSGGRWSPRNAVRRSPSGGLAPLAAWASGSAGRRRGLSADVLLADHAVADSPGRSSPVVLAIVTSPDRYIERCGGERDRRGRSRSGRRERIVRGRRRWAGRSPGSPSALRTHGARRPC